MKKEICIGLSAALCAGMLAGCGVTLETDARLIYLDKKGAVTALDVEKLSPGDREEFEVFVEQEVDAYNEMHGKGSIKVEELEVEDQAARLQLRYETAEDYAAFNGIELYQGNVAASMEAGYAYDAVFSRVEGGKVAGSVTKQDLYGQQDLKVVIVRANTDVKVEGVICYVSNENVRLTGADSVSIREGYGISDTDAELVSEGTERGAEEMQETGRDAFETDVYTYIIYK